MKVYNPKSNFTTHKEIINLLENYRRIKYFSPLPYANKKASLLNQYMKKFGLKSCVVAVSGGIDSAAVLALVNYASKLPHSPIEKIIAVSLPVSQSVGATGQLEATQRAEELCKVLNIPLHTIELNSAHKTIENLVSNNLEIKSDSWALGQLVAHTRTPTLYYTATLLTQEGLPAIIVGTTNRDEGLYLGYFGKASDGLVDVQLISDLHKSEVYKLAEEFKVPKSILTVSPQGDMYDGRIDEEVFGASYDFVEYYLHFMSLNHNLQEQIIQSLSQEALEQFNFFKNNLDNLHKYNRHKYFSASPAVHLDLDDMYIPEGWKTNCNFNRLQDKPINFNNMVGLFELDTLPNIFNQNKNHSLHTYCLPGGKKNILHLQNVLRPEECEWLLKQTDGKNWLPANLYGKQKDFNPELEKEMSHRLSVYNELLAYQLFSRIRSNLPPFKEFDSPLPLISNQHPFWSAKSINPLFRYIRYQPGHSLIAHYDDTYEYNDYKKTLLTMVIYLDNSNAKTRFLIDKQENIPDSEKNFSDWDRLAYQEEVLCEFEAKAGDILIFDHRVLHDATSPDIIKHILRTDIIFEAPNFGFDL